MTTKRLLLIEDDKDNRYLLDFALREQTNWKIKSVSNGIEGIEIAESELPDAILLDYMMPRMDGLEAYKTLQKNLLTRTIPVIFITAMVNTVSLDLLKNTHAVGIITKPLNIISLATQIENMCDW